VRRIDDKKPATLFHTGIILECQRKWLAHRLRACHNGICHMCRLCIINDVQLDAATMATAAAACITW